MLGALAPPAGPEAGHSITQDMGAMLQKLMSLPVPSDPPGSPRRSGSAIVTPSVEDVSVEAQRSRETGSETTVAKLSLSEPHPSATPTPEEWSGSGFPQCHGDGHPRSKQVPGGQRWTFPPIVHRTTRSRAKSKRKAKLAAAGGGRSGQRPADAEPSASGSGHSTQSGHRNDLLLRSSDTFTLHLVYPADCSNNCTIRYNHVEASQTDFTEEDGGKSIFRCVDGTDCVCPVSDQAVAFPVAALDFDSFERMHHIKTRNCRICRPGLGLARAAITGRMRLIYEQSSTVEPEQVVFRIWEHEGGRTAEPADKQPPATNTLVTVERTSDRVLKPAEYEALFSVLIDLRRVQSVHVFSWMVWTSNDYFDIREMVDDLKDAGLLALDRDGKLRASGSCRCDGGLRATAADVYPELNMLNLHTLERTSKKFAKGETKKKRIQGLFGMMDDVVAGKHADVDWESLLKYNDPSSEEAYLDIPKSRTQHEMLTDYGRRSEPGTLLNKFLQGLYEVSDLNVTAVCCAWKLRKSLGDVVRDRARAHRSALRRSTTTDQPVRENSPLDDAVRGNNVYVSLRDIVPSRTGATNPSTAAPKSSAASHAQQEGTSSESSAIVRDDSDVKALAAAGKAEWHVSKGPTTNSPARSPTPPEDERALATTLQQYLTSSSLSRVSSLDSGCPAAEGGSQGDRSAAASSDTPPSSHSGLTSPSGHERPAGSDEARGSDSDATGADSEPPPEAETPPDRQHPHDSKASSDLGVLTTDSDMNGVGLSQTKGQGDSTAADYVSEGRHEQEAMPQRRPEHEDAPHQDEDVLSDSSTLRGSASSVSKDSRRRSSSGDFSEASDLDDSGSAFSKSFSPSKGQGHVGRESQDEVRSPGERIRPLIIPEEENSSEAEAPSNLRDDGRKTVPEQMSGHEARPGHAECTAGDTTKDVQGKRLIPPSSRPSTGGTSKDAAGVKSEPQNMKTGESDKMEAAASQARDDAERPPAIDVDETADTIKTLVEACMAGNHDALSQYLEQAKMEMSGQRSLAIIGHQTLLEERTYVRCYRYAINLTTDYSTQNSGGDAWLTGAETGEDSFGASRTELTSASVKDFATVRATSGDVFMAVDLCSEGVPAIPETPEVSKDEDLQSNVAAATAEGGSLWPSEDSPNEYSEEDTTHYFGLNSIIQRQQIKRTRQARFLCRQLINQPGQYINCMCMFQIQQEHTHRLRSLLDEMLKKGRFFAFLEHQDNAIGHVCKNSVMATVWEARKAREERIEHLQDYMIVLGLNQNPSVHSRFFCTPGKHENVTGAKTSRTDGTESASERQLAEITPEKCSLRVCKHHLKQIASPKCFFDVTRRDPVTHMSLHEELLSKALRTSGQTPYEMFTSVYITQKLLRTLCEACNRYLRGGKRRDQPCRKISEGEMRLFILQMVYLASRHSVHKRWDRAPRGRRCSRTPVTPPVAEEPHETADTGDPERSLSTDQPSRPREDCTNEDLAQGNATEDPDQSAPAAGSGPQRGSPEPTKRGANGGDGPASRGRANPARLRRCMTRTRFGEIADSWCAFDFCEQPQDVSRLEALREAIDVLMGSAPVAARPALLAAATRPVRCRWDRHRL
ncbi:uncharacterized protein LOC119110144, partial [Pollicipes pollicipes]|uniref:uncharacterized protein LOC119110144 n=1 Tax=Pollicipes pollicipes TaxID=41117 RepID=UPI0018855670